MTRAGLRWGPVEYSGLGTFKQGAEATAELLQLYMGDGMVFEKSWRYPTHEDDDNL